MRTLTLLVGLVGLAWMTGCGGSGAGAGPTPSATTRVGGNIVAVDGNTTALGGLTVRSPATGTKTVTAADGSFSLGDQPAGPTTLVVREPVRAAGVEVERETEVEIELEHGGETEIHISLENGSVGRLSVDRSCGGSDPSNSTTAPLASEDGSHHGTVRLVQHGGGEQEFEVEIEGLEVHRSAEVHVSGADDGGNGGGKRMRRGSEGTATMRIETRKGEALPAGASHVTELEGRTVEVVDPATGEVLLTGTVPLAGGVPTCSEDDNGQDPAGTDDNPHVDQNDGTAVGGAVGHAEVNLVSRTDRPEERFAAEVRGFTEAVGLELWLEDPAEPGVLKLVGTLEPIAAGAFELERSSRKGQALPFDAAKASDLQNLSYEIRRQGDGTVAFRGTTPAMVKA